MIDTINIASFQEYYKNLLTTSYCVIPCVPMTFPQVGRADPGHHQHQAGQVRAVVDRQLIHHQAGHVVHPIVVCQLDSTIFNWVAIWPRLLRETRLQLSKPVR